MLNSLGNQTDIAAFNISFSILTQRRLVILFGNQLSSFVNSEMAYKKIIVILTNQLRLNNLRDAGEVLILEYSFDIFLALKKLCSP